MFDIFINGVNPIEAIKNNLGGILTTLILAPLVVGLIKLLALPALVATILKFILGSITFGFGKNLLSKFRFGGGGTGQNQEQVDIKPIDETTETVSFGMMEGNNINPSTDNTLVAKQQKVVLMPLFPLILRES